MLLIAEKLQGEKVSTCTWSDIHSTRCEHQEPPAHPSQWPGTGSEMETDSYLPEAPGGSTFRCKVLTSGPHYGPSRQGCLNPCLTDEEMGLLSLVLSEGAGGRHSGALSMTITLD